MGEGDDDPTAHARPVVIPRGRPTGRSRDDDDDHRPTTSSWTQATPSRRVRCRRAAVAAGRLRDRPRRRDRRRRRHRAVPGRVRTRRSRRCAPPATGPGAPPRTRPSSRATTTATRRRAPRRSSTRGWPASSSRSLDPDAKVAGTGLERLRAAGVATTVGPKAPTTSSTASTPYLHQRAHRPRLHGAEDRDEPRRPDRGSRRHERSGSRAPRPAADVHMLRADSHAIVVGPATAIADRPTLTARDVRAARLGSAAARPARRPRAACRSRARSPTRRWRRPPCTRPTGCRR